MATMEATLALHEQIRATLCRTDIDAELALVELRVLFAFGPSATETPPSQGDAPRAPCPARRPRAAAVAAAAAISADAASNVTASRDAPRSRSRSPLPAISLAKRQLGDFVLNRESPRPVALSPSRSSARSSAPSSVNGDDEERFIDANNIMETDSEPASIKRTAAAMSSSASDADSDRTVRGSDADGFETVKRKTKRKKSAVLSPAPQAKTPAPPSPRPRKSGRKSPSTSNPVPVVVKPPPPVCLRDKAKWPIVSNLCRDQGIAWTKAVNKRDSITITVPDVTTYRSLTRLLTSRDIGYHTYTLPEERKVRCVLRGVPHECDNETLLASLLEQGFPVEAVHKMYGNKGKAFELAFVVLTPSEAGHNIYKATPHYMGMQLTVEPPNKKSGPGQCHRCQLYGHSAYNCSAKPRCVKCLEPHSTKECSRTRDSPTPPACVLCGQSGHTANYKGCPRAPKSVKTTRKSQSRKAPSGPKKANQPPPVPAISANSEFPTIKYGRETTVPPPVENWRTGERPNSSAKPPPSKKAGPGPKPHPSGPKPQPTQPASPLMDDVGVINNSLDRIDLAEVAILAAKLRNAQTGKERLLALCAHIDLIKALE